MNEASHLRRFASLVLPRHLKLLLGNLGVLCAKLLLRFNRTVFCSNRLRMTIYRRLGVQADEGSIIWCGARINHLGRIRIGRNSIVGPDTVLLSQGGIRIGANVNISGFSYIISQEHNTRSPGLETSLAEVVIEDYAWLATNVTVLPGVRIGRGAVVAAGAVVARSVEPCTIVGGNPARKIGTRCDELAYHTRDDTGLKWL